VPDKRRFDLNERSASEREGEFAFERKKRQQVFGGDGGIRTLDRALQPYNGLANRRLQPLGHVSGVESIEILEISLLSRGIWRICRGLVKNQVAALAAGLRSPCARQSRKPACSFDRYATSDAPKLCSAASKRELRQ
jgi:hypothetical protein